MILTVIIDLFFWWCCSFWIGDRRSEMVENDVALFCIEDRGSQICIAQIYFHDCTHRVSGSHILDQRSQIGDHVRPMFCHVLPWLGFLRKTQKRQATAPTWTLYKTQNDIRDRGWRSAYDFWNEFATVFQLQKRERATLAVHLLYKFEKRFPATLNDNSCFRGPFATMGDLMAWASKPQMSTS